MRIVRNEGNMLTPFSRMPYGVNLQIKQRLSSRKSFWIANDMACVSYIGPKHKIMEIADKNTCEILK